VLVKKIEGDIMSFSVGSNFLMSNFVAPGTFSTTTAPGGGAPTGQMYQMNDGKSQYYSTSGTAWGNSSLFLADAGDVIHLSGGGWDAGVDATTNVANGVGTVSGKLYTSGDKKVFVAGGAKVDTSDAKAQPNKDALKADITTLEDGKNIDGDINKDELTANINKFSGAKKSFWESILQSFDSLKNDKGLINTDILANKDYVDQA